MCATLSVVLTHHPPRATPIPRIHRVVPGRAPRAGGCGPSASRRTQTEACWLGSWAGAQHFRPAHPKLAAARAQLQETHCILYQPRVATCLKPGGPYSPEDSSSVREDTVYTIASPDRGMLFLSRPSMFNPTLLLGQAWSTR